MTNHSDTWGLADKSVLVTGASSGIGRATAVLLGRYGSRLVLASRSRENNEETAEMVRAEGGEAIAVIADISKIDDVRSAVAVAVDAYGGLDCAINNAGRVGLPATTATQEVAEWEQVIATNLTGTWLCMKFELAEMLKQGHGVIVNVASAGGLIAAPGMPAYSASKAGIIGITRTAAIENAEAGIRVNALCPGPVETTMTRQMSANGGPSAAETAQFIPVKRVADASELAAAAVWLCSDASSYVTGAVLAADGGMSAA